MPDFVPAVVHVPAALVQDFDCSKAPSANQDRPAAWAALRQEPDIFGLPHYGGYWIAAHTVDIESIQVRPEPRLHYCTADEDRSLTSTQYDEGDKHGIL